MCQGLLFCLESCSSSLLIVFNDLYITQLLLYDVSKFVYDGNIMISGAAESLHETAR